jgi:O-antigen/teichoic acid export membrane protein
MPADQTKQSIEVPSSAAQVKQQAISGVLRTAAFTLIGRITTLIALFITGKLLPREAFAVYAFCYSSSAIFAGLGRGSIAGLLLQKPKLFHRLRRPALAYSLTLNLSGIFTGLCIIVLSNRLFNVWECAIVGLTLGVRAFLNTPITLYTTQISSALAFKQLTNVRIVSITLKNITSILLAFLGAGVHALSVPIMMATVYETITFRSIVKRVAQPPQIERKPSKRVLGWLIRQSKWLIAVTILTACMMNVDYFVVGQIGTAQQLAGYYFAFQLTASVLEILISGIQTVTIPVLVALKQHRQDVGQSIIRACQALNLIGLPTGFALATIVGPAVWILWGNKWIDATPCAELLALAVIPRSFIALLNSTLDAAGAWSTRTFLLTADIIGTGLITWAGIYSGGITYIGLYILIFSSCYSIIWCFIVSREFNIQVRNLIRTNTTNLAMILGATIGHLCLPFLLSEETLNIPFASSIWWGAMFVVQMIVLMIFERPALQMAWENTEGIRRRFNLKRAVEWDKVVPPS